MPSASARSPNWRSRSTSATLAPSDASATARFDETTVLPAPPFGPSTQIIREWASADGDGVPLLRATAFCSVNSTSASLGGLVTVPGSGASMSTSSAPASNAAPTNPFGAPW